MLRAVSRVVLLPGLDGTGRLFAPLLRELPAHLTVDVIAFPERSALGYEGLLAHVNEKLPEVGDFIVVAESFSGPLAIMLAAEHPRGLRGLVLCATFTTLASSWLQAALPAVSIVPPHAIPVRPLSWLLAGSAATAELRTMLRESLRSVPAEVLKARARAALNIDVRAQAKDLTSPVMLIRPNADRLIPADIYDRTEKALPNPRVRRLNGPHFVLQTCPSACANEIRQFLEAV
jgi:pimeloyl-ACP methyl ester carboxylesterase